MSTITAAAEKYAKETLGMQITWDDTTGLLVHLNELYAQRAELESETRHIATATDRRKMAIIEEVTLQKPEESVAAHERSVRIALANDEEFQKLLDRQNGVMAQRDAIGAIISGGENQVRANSARLVNLGGYFNMMASAKSADLEEKLNRQESPF